MTSIHVHELGGCAPRPLGHYLKALGILRLVVEQADAEARGWWASERFQLSTSLDAAALQRFFLHDYQPTPLLSPWNGGSGFYDAGKEDDPLVPISTSIAQRFGPLRQAVAGARQLLGGRTEKPDAGDEKSQVVRTFKSRANGASRAWLDACVVILTDERGNAVPRYPGLFGTGGNDGNLEYTDQFLRQLPLLFCVSTTGEPTPAASSWLKAALFGIPCNGLTDGGSGRQFDPGGGGGKNGSAGFSGPSLLNPWDLVLLLEGSVLFAAAAHRRLATSAEPGLAAAPFAMYAAAAGSGTGADGEEGHQEQWLPIWGRPCRLDELRAMITEGRASLGTRSTARSVDFARSIARLGVARGLDSFERYAFHKRNGNMHLAVPLGRWPVAPQPHQQLLDDVDGWLDRARRAARDDHASASLRSAVRRTDEAVLEVCRAGGVPPRWQGLLSELGDAEAAIARGKKRRAEGWLRPLPPLSPGWVEAASDASAELRLALALASQSVREHWLPLEKSGRRFAAEATPDVVCAGQDLERDCIALVRRRVVRMRAGGLDHVALVAVAGCGVHAADIRAFLAFQVDDRLVLRLSRALMALDFERLRNVPSPPDVEAPDPLYALFRLSFLPGPLHRGRDSIRIACDPEVLARLTAGDASAAAAIALRRLRASGLRPVIREIATSARVARRLASALAFPLADPDFARCAEVVTKPYQAPNAGAATDTSSEAS